MGFLAWSYSARSCTSYIKLALNQNSNAHVNQICQSRKEVRYLRFPAFMKGFFTLGPGLFTLDRTSCCRIFQAIFRQALALHGFYFGGIVLYEL